MLIVRYFKSHESVYCKSLSILGHKFQLTTPYFSLKCDVSLLLKEHTQTY